ncbi:MAG: hypothetical protein NWE78_08055 [Candidatus Bathyarchaeota archaeon]|nr:hypothetical protein [Candidatus Bathyarchaeota archaeon]
MDGRGAKRLWASARLLYKLLPSLIEDNMVNKKSQSIPFSVRLCSDKAAFEVRIQQNIHFNMTNLGRLLKSVEEMEIIADTPHIIIFRSKGAEVTLSRNGRMLIKRIEDEKEAVAVASEILRVLSLMSEDLQV